RVSATGIAAPSCPGRAGSCARTASRLAPGIPGSTSASGETRRYQHMAMHHPTSQVLRTVPAGATPRILLSALGAAGLIAAAFQSWTRDLQGTDVSWRSVYRDSIGSTDDIVQSIGGAAILFGVIAVMG